MRRRAGSYILLKSLRVCTIVVYVRVYSKSDYIFYFIYYIYLFCSISCLFRGSLRVKFSKWKLKRARYMEDCAAKCRTVEYYHKNVMRTTILYYSHYYTNTSWTCFEKHDKNIEILKAQQYNIIIFGKTALSMKMFSLLIFLFIWHNNYHFYIFWALLSTYFN